MVGDSTFFETMMTVSREAKEFKTVPLKFTSQHTHTHTWHDIRERVFLLQRLEGSAHQVFTSKSL